MNKYIIIILTSVVCCTSFFDHNLYFNQRVISRYVYEYGFTNVSQEKHFEKIIDLLPVSDYYIIEFLDEEESILNDNVDDCQDFEEEIIGKYNVLVTTFHPEYYSKHHYREKFKKFITVKDKILLIKGRNIPSSLYYKRNKKVVNIEYAEDDCLCSESEILLLLKDGIINAVYNIKELLEIYGAIVRP